MKKIILLLGLVMTCTAPFAQTVISGQITLGTTGTAAYPATVYIIQEAFVDSLLGTRDILLTVIDSTTTDSMGNYSATVTGSSSPDSQILVKAALDPSSADYSNYLPTYYSADPAVIALTWDLGAMLPQPLPSNDTANIALAAGINPGGPGFISGSVFAGAGRMTKVGDPLKSRILILADMSGNPVAYTYSDAMGKFKFDNIAYGSYELFGDAGGKLNPYLTVTLSASKTTVSNIVFEENSTSFSGHYVTTAVNNVSSPLINVTVYPNPITDQINVSGLNQINGTKEILLNNIDGSNVYKYTFSGTEQVAIPASNLPAGTYMLQVKTTDGERVFKIVK